LYAFHEVLVKGGKNEKNAKDGQKDTSLSYEYTTTADNLIVVRPNEQSSSRASAVGQIYKKEDNTTATLSLKYWWDMQSSREEPSVKSTGIPGILFSYNCSDTILNLTASFEHLGRSYTFNRG
jgi:hypothetical protein